MPRIPSTLRRNREEIFPSMIQTEAIRYGVTCGVGVLILTAFGWTDRRRHERNHSKDSASVQLEEPVQSEKPHSRAPITASVTMAYAENIYRMAESGMPMREIAQTLSCSQAEIDLLLHLHALGNEQTASSGDESA